MRKPSRAFTLTELLVAIAVLVGVLLVSSKIFSTTSQVASVGEATADVLQDVAAIERRIRGDFERATGEGVLAIRSVAVRNDFHGLGRPLLNPGLPPTAKLRCDQVVFFANGRTSSQNFAAGANVGANRKGSSNVARIYYGHAFQLGPEGRPVDDAGGIRAFDIDQRVFPWTRDAVDTIRTLYEGPSALQQSGSSTAVPENLDARRWLFARHAVMLADDGGGDLYLNQVRGAPSVFYVDPELGATPWVQTGRVDASSMQMNDLRRKLLYSDTGVWPPVVRPWRDPTAPFGQYELIRDQLIYYPRAERQAPSMNRVDQTLTNNVMLSAVSQVRIDWTWEEGVGAQRDAEGSIAVAPGLDGILGTGDDGLLTGLRYDRTVSEETRWFGMSDDVHLLQEEKRGVQPYATFGSWGWDAPTATTQTIFPGNVEEFGPAAGVDVYTAIFGLNQSVALDGIGNPDELLGYTPWPTALRITLTVHDPRGVLENGREIQFIIPLPRHDAR